jgi:hypothetical protein
MESTRIHDIIAQAASILGYEFLNSWHCSATKFLELLVEIVLQEISEKYDERLERGESVMSGRPYVESYTVVPELQGVVLEIRVPLYLGDSEYDEEADRYVDLPTGGSIVVMMTNKGTLAVMRHLQTGYPIREEVIQ